MRVVMLGPPGSGKGTQGMRLAAGVGVPHVSTGDMLRDAREAGTDLGRRAAQHMDRGDLVPDDVMVRIVAERIDTPDCLRGFVLDGFPRTVNQAEALQAKLAGDERDLHHVVSLVVRRDELIRRLADRRTCASCGRSWAPAEIEGADGTCSCGGQLVVREDDRPESVSRRLDVYASRTEPLRAWYESKGLLRHVDGNGTVEAVAERVSTAVGSAKAG